MADHDATPAHPGRSRNLARRAATELGLSSLWHCARDAKLLIAARFVRLFAYGASTLVLVRHLEVLGVSPARAGLFMTLTLAGDVGISFALTLVADGVGRRVVLALGAALMAASGIVFAIAEDYWVLLAAAVFGVISPSGNEIGPFRAIEESTLAHLTESAVRSDIYAWYGLIGTAGAALGMVTCGWVVHHLHFDLGWTFRDAYRSVFFAYAALGVLKLLMTLLMSRRVEVEKRDAKKKKRTTTTAATTTPDQDAGEETPLLAESTADTNGDHNVVNGVNGNGDEAGDEQAPKGHGFNWSRLRALLPDISRESISVIISLCLLFALDNFASGLAPLSWVTFFFRTHYNLEEGLLGSVFFATSIISAASMLAASALARRIGNVNTMVFTHLPSSIFLALIPLPNEVHLSLILLVLRACTQSMDSAPRSAFLAAIVLPGERTAVMGLINLVKTTAQSLGPLITGLLASRGLFWVAFVCAGSLKATYDLGLLALFKNHERERAERERLAAAAAAAEGEEEGGLEDRDGEGQQEGRVAGA